MKIQSIMIGLFAVGTLLISGPVFAEMVSGHVTAVNPENQTLTLQRMTPSGEFEDIEVAVSEQSSFRGDISSLDQIAVGDEIRLDAQKPSLGIGNWEANWIEPAQQGAGLGEELPGEAIPAGGEAGEEAGAGAQQGQF